MKVTINTDERYKETEVTVNCNHMSDDIDKHTFLYTSNGVYESSLKLYELEAKLADRDFIRASKNSLFNISHIQAIEPDFYFGAFYYCP
jgi:hypothetical protein